MDEKIEELQNKIEELSGKIVLLEKKLEEKSSDFIVLKDKFKTHNHNGYDDTNTLTGTINLRDTSFINVGNSYRAVFNQWVGLSTEENRMIFAVGDDNDSGFGNSTTNTQIEIINQPGTNGSSNQSFIQAFRSPVYSGTGVSVTSGSNTITDTSFNWDTDELAGAYIVLYDSNSVLKETLSISSNTATVITLSTNASYTDANSSYIVFMPVYLGSAAHPFRRIYTGEGTGEGIRFGYGATAGGQNGLLYMDSTGDLYWRNKGGTAVKLN